MTRATLCALLAGLLAAGALADLAAARRPRAARRRHRPAAVALLARLGRRLGLRVAPADLVARHEAAGAPGGVSLADLAALKGAGAVAGALVALPLALGAPGRLGPLLLVAAPAGGFLVPDVWLARRARSRAAVMAAELADVLDLLRVAVEAGLPVTRALADVGRRHPGTLAAELRASAGAIELGVPRAQALARLRRRAPLEHVAALVAAIERSERHGAPLSPALAALAREARAEAGRRLTEHAARAAPKIQLAVALLLVPSVLLLVAAGAVATLLPS
jgi:tight adherence protein C